MRTRVRLPVAVAFAAVFIVGVTGQGLAADEGWVYASQDRYAQADLPRLEKAYVGSLEYPVEGIVESALREVARIKITHLDWESPALMERLEAIAREGVTPSIRYKASLVRAVFDTPELFALEGGRDFRTPAELYLAVARRLEDSLIAGQ